MKGPLHHEIALQRPCDKREGGGDQIGTVTLTCEARHHAPCRLQVHHLAATGLPSVGQGGGVFAVYGVAGPTGCHRHTALANHTTRCEWQGMLPSLQWQDSLPSLLGHTEAFVEIWARLPQRETLIGRAKCPLREATIRNVEVATGQRPRGNGATSFTLPLRNKGQAAGVVRGEWTLLEGPTEAQLVQGAARHMPVPCHTAGHEGGARDAPLEHALLCDMTGIETLLPGLPLPEAESLAAPP